MNIKGQSFLKLLDFTPEQITDFLTLAADLKAGSSVLPIRIPRGAKRYLRLNYAITGTLFVTLAFPGFIYRYLLRRHG